MTTEKERSFFGFPFGLWSFSASLFAGAGGSITFGADNSSGRQFLTMRFGYGLGAGASFDENDSSPVPQCSQSGPNASLGVYAEALVNNGPHEFGYTSGFGVSSRRGIPYYRITSPVNTLGTSSGVGGGASMGLSYHSFDEETMKKKLLITLGLLTVFFAVFHFIDANSDGFEIASKYLKDNAEVVKIVGEVSAVSLIPLASDLKDFGNEGNATYHIKVVGSKTSAEGVVTSIKTDGIWKVEKAHLLMENKDIVILKQ